MKKTLQFASSLLLLSFIFLGCDDRHNNDVPSEIAVNNFVWKGLNLYYLWQADVPNLSDYRFENQSQLNAYLYNYASPANLFQDLLHKPSSKFPAGEAIDRFSVIFADYTQLEGILSGTTKNNGADFALYYKDETRTAIFGVIRYILPNSDAATKPIARGDIFYAIDGQALNIDNYASLLNRDSYTMNLADYDGGNITPNGNSVSLTRSILSENPVHIHKVINEGTHKIGYLMYNGFYPSYEPELNNAFGEFKSQGITELVLDLRYNGGGSVQTATHLASMITGQYTGQVFAKEQWNAKVEDFYAANNPANLYNLFSNTIKSNVAINSLGLNKVYILTSGATASASELVINGLEPYINVVQIGDVTVGKNVGSVTLYDSPTFAKKDLSTKHRYAMQPLVLKIVNKVGFGDYVNGLQPDDLLRENLGNMGVLGDATEPLLSAVITRIIGGGRPVDRVPYKTFKSLKDERLLSQLKNEMYVETIPEGLGLK